MDYNFWDDRTHEVEINPCEGCYDYQNRKCISNGGCGDEGTAVEDVTRKAIEVKNDQKCRITCSNCGALLEFEKDAIKNVRTGVDVYEQQIVCPACNEIVSVQITFVD